MDSQTPTLASERALPPGTLLQRFEIVRALMETASGIDYLALDLQRDTEVVIREYFPQRLARRIQQAMAPRATEDTEALARGLQAFLNEGHLLARIEHPSLAHVLAVIEANGTAYQVQPRLGGVTLLEVRKEMRAPPDEHSVRALIDGLLSALQALHDEGVVHGGVAPANVLLLANDHPLLLGPDLARAESANELIESLMASVEPAFGAPEQRQPGTDKPLGPWTDLYGVAATMRYFIGGELPPPVHEWPPEGAHEPMADMVRRICTGYDAPRYSDALLNALDAALGYVPGARPRSVAGFRGALGTLPRREPKRRTPISPPAPPPLPAPSTTPAPAAPDVIAAPNSPPPVDSVPGMLASRFIEPDPEPDNADIDRIVARPGMRADERHRPLMPRHGARWIGATFVLALAAAGLGGWWAMRDAPLLIPPTSSGPAVTEPVPMRTEPATGAATPAPAPAPAPTPSPAPAPSITPAPTSAVPRHEAVVPPVSARTPARAARHAPTTASTAAPIAATKVAPQPPAPANPREICGDRTQFALYRCMQTQCATAKWIEHPQCIRLRATDSVD